MPRTGLRAENGGKEALTIWPMRFVLLEAPDPSENLMKVLVFSHMWGIGTGS